MSLLHQLAWYLNDMHCIAPREKMNKLLLTATNTLFNEWYFEQKQESQSDKYSGAAGIVSLNSHSKNTHAVCKLLPFPCGVDFCLSHQVSSLAMPLRRWVAGLGIPINIQFHPGQPTHPSGYNDPETGQDRSSVGHSIRSWSNSLKPKQQFKKIYAEKSP